MKNVPYCKYCTYCKDLYRSRTQIMSIGRKHYYCTNPMAKTPDNRATGFIAFGENSYESPIQIKTSPRWCPMREVNNHD